MKRKPPDSRNALSALRLSFALSLATLIPLLLYGSAPTWWSQRGVLVENAVPDDYAPANQGQLKNIAKAAVAEMDAKLSVGAGEALHQLVASWSNPSPETNDFAPVNLGQLKNVVKPFYDRLIAAGIVDTYPWETSLSSPDDFAVANVGQVKNVFDFAIPAANSPDDPNADRIAASAFAGNLALEANAIWIWNDQWANPDNLGIHLPRRMSGLPPAKSVTARDSYLAVLAVDGTVWTWGDNTYGQLGDGSTASRTVPLPVPSLTGVSSVKAGSGHMLALLDDGTVMAWGANRFGQLGTGDQTPSTDPEVIPLLDGVHKIAAGYDSSAALKNDGTVWTWGYQRYNHGQNAFNSTPALVPELESVIDVAAGYEHVVAVKSDGTVWAWGSNYADQVGNGKPWWQYQDVPFQVPNLPSIVKVASAYDHTLAIATDGTVWAWGYNFNGQLGDGTSEARQTPVQVVGITDVIAISTAYTFSLAMKADGTVWAWGDGATGILPGADRHRPQQVGLGLYDSNYNAMDDRWEMRFFGDLSQSGDGDWDGDGISNRLEYLRGTDPSDYYNGARPIVEIVSGNNQVGDPGAFLSKPVKVRVKNATGQLLVNAPVLFHVLDGLGGVVASPGVEVQQQLLARTDSNGETSAYQTLPDLAGISVRTEATAGSADQTSSVTFRSIVKFSPPPPPTPPPNPSATPGGSPTPSPSPSATPIAPYRYAIIDLGPDIYPIKINNKGTILVGGPDPNSTDNWGYGRWRGGTIEWLRYTGSYSSFSPKDINDLDTVVGSLSQSAPLPNDEREFEAGLVWFPGSSTANKLSAPASYHGWNGFTSTLNYRSASITAINNLNEAYGQILTQTVRGFLFSTLFVMNSARWPGASGFPLQLSNATGVNDNPNDLFYSSWTGSIDAIVRASSKHYVGIKITPEPRLAGFISGSQTGMIDGRSVDFTPRYVNEGGLVAGDASNGDMIVRALADSPLLPIPDLKVNGNNAIALNDHVRPATPPNALPSPTATPQPTPIPAPQVLSWMGNALALWELQPDAHTWHPFGLEEMIPSMDGWNYLEPSDMNDSGAIIGRGWYTDPSIPGAKGKTHGFLLVPAELMVDANRDGEMSFDDPAVHDADRTFEEKPYRFWINDDHDIYHTVDGDDAEYDDASDGSRDCDYTTIYSMRDLEDFSRLRISFKGLTDLIKNVDYTVSLEWRSNDGDRIVPATDGAPEIVLYQEKQPEVRPLYLEDEAAALAQVRSPFDTWIGSAKSGQSVDLFARRPGMRTTLSEDAPFVALLFCGKNAGRGQLLVSVRKGGKTVIEFPPAYVELLNIKDMYERWTVGDDPGADPEVLPLLSDRSLPTGYSNGGRPRPFAYRSDDREESQYILYVHGWNVRPEEKDQFAETAFKRLFWQGYKGRFGVFGWPTTYGFGALLSDDTKWKNAVNGIYSAVSDPTNYDRGEWSAWRSGLGLKRLLIRLNHSYPGNVYMFAHSMGNVVAGEALRIAAQDGSGSLVNTYVASQGAVPVHCYAGDQNAPLDAQVPAEALLRMFDGGYPETPNVYLDWLSANGSSVGRRINFFNVNDYALWNDVWQLNQYFKPDRLDPPDLEWTYRYVGQPTTSAAPNGFRKDYYDPQNAAQDVHLQLGDAVEVKDRYEIMSFAAEARSKALGGTPNVNTLTDNINLQSLWPPDTDGRQRPYSSHKWHSAEFRSTNMRQRKYWQTMLGPRAFNILPERP